MSFFDRLTRLVNPALPGDLLFSIKGSNNSLSGRSLSQTHF